MLPKTHLALHSRMSGSRWVIMPSWLSGLWRSFLCSFSVCSSHLFLISSASVRSILFLSYIVAIFAWTLPLVSLIFLKRSLVFPFYCCPVFLCIDHWGRLSYLSLLFFGTLHSNIYISFLLSFALTSLLFTAICKASSDNHLPFCISFSWGWSWYLPPIQCHKPPSIVLQAQLMLWKCFTQYASKLENSAVATGLEKVSFHSNPKERQSQRMLKLPHNCSHLTC